MESVSNKGAVRILVLTNLYPPHFIGGYELICQTVVETLRERGHALAILTSDHTVASAGPESAQLPVERSLAINGLYGHPWRGFREIRWLEKRNNDALRAALARHQPDLVYVWNMGGLSKSMLFSLQARGVPTVYYLSDHWISRAAESDVWIRWWNHAGLPCTRRLLRGCLELTGARKRWDALAPTAPLQHLRFERIYFCSRALRQSTAAAGYDVGHGAVIPCPVHPRYFQGDSPPLKRQLQRLLYVGRLSADKGVLTALRALALLQGQWDGQLTICGRGDPSYVAGLQQFIREHRLNVTIKAAALDEMPHVYRTHDLLLFTSEWEEPFALTPLEAMACGRPVIGTTTGGSAELFRHRENSLTYAAGDARQLALCIREFASDFNLRVCCARTGLAEARQRFAASVIVDQIEDYLQESLRPIRRPRHFTAINSTLPA